MKSNDQKTLSHFAREIHQRLLCFYGEPEWRNPLPPVDELVSTILSQNTNDVNRDKAFDSLRERFPTWEAVRDAPTKEIIEAVRIAGLANQKGPRLQNVLRQITEERGELDLTFLKSWPPDEVRDWLLKFKGVGPKTAAIVMQFSLGHARLPRRHARLPRHRPPRPAPGGDERRESPRPPGRPLPPRDLRHRPPQHHPSRPRDLPCPQA